MLDRTNAGAAGADEANRIAEPKHNALRRRSKRDGHAKPVTHTKRAITSDERAHQSGENHFGSSPLVATNSDAGARLPIEVPFTTSPTVEPLNLGDDGAQMQRVNHSDYSPIIIEIVQLWRMRQRWHRAEKSLTLQGKAICRAFCEGDKEQANKLFDQVAAGEGGDQIARVALAPFLASIERFEPERKAIEKRLRKLAHELPIWPWVKANKGFGDLNLAALVGECGDIGSYRNPSCLWKRMGLAVIDGGRQRKVTDAEAALIHGYNPARRAVAFLLSDCLIKAAGPFKLVYDERKAHELTREGMTPIHAHRRAARYMVKRVLRNLWVEWRSGGAYVL